MSELAINEHGEERSSYEFREEYLRTGIIYYEFVCVLCSVPLVANAIYGIKFKKAPYFSVRDSKHREGCIYAGGRKTTSMRAKRRRKRIYGTYVDIPEKLIARRKVARQSIIDCPSQRLTQQDIAERVASRRESLKIDNHYTTSLLRSVTAAYENTWDACHKESVKRGLNRNEENSFIINKLESIPLSLYGRNTNYRDAFRRTNITPTDAEWIYYGKGAVTKASEEYIICSTKKIKGQHLISMKAIIVIAIPTPMSRLAENLVSVLENAAKAGIKVKWFCYGKLKYFDTDQSYKMRIEDEEHVYLKT